MSSASCSTTFATRPAASFNERLLICASAFRRRIVSSLRSAMATDGKSCRSLRKSRRCIMNNSDFVIATTLADRARPSRIAISPKKSLSPRMESITSRPSSSIRTIFTFPETMTKSAAPASSSRRMMLPFLYFFRTPTLEMVSRSIGSRSHRIGTFLRNSISSFTAAFRVTSLRIWEDCRLGLATLATSVNILRNIGSRVMKVKKPGRVPCPWPLHGDINQSCQSERRKYAKKANPTCVARRASAADVSSRCVARCKAGSPVSW